MRKVTCDKVVTSAHSESIAVASTATVYTKSFRLDYADYFSVSYKALSSSGTPAIKIELEQSFALPTTEGSSDNNWVEPEGMQDIESALATETWHHKTLSPVPLPYGRFKITGGATNPSDTIVSMYINRQEEL